MPIMAIHVIQDDISHEQLLEEFAKLQKVVKYLVNGQLDFENIRVKGIVAENIDVQNLSAISANLGKITSGEIYGAYIATGEGVFPRIEFSSSGNLMAAYLNADYYIALDPDLTGTPTLVFYDNGAALGILSYIQNTGIILTAMQGSITITPQSVLNLPAWNRIFNSSNQSLQQALDAKANGSGINGTVYVSATPGGPANVPISFSNGVRTS